MQDLQLVIIRNKPPISTENWIRPARLRGAASRLKTTTGESTTDYLKTVRKVFVLFFFLLTVSQYTRGLV